MLAQDPRRGGGSRGSARPVAPAGVRAHLVGRVGHDEMGRLLLQHLQGNAKLYCLDTSGVVIDRESSTGVAVQLATAQAGPRPSARRSARRSTRRPARRAPPRAARRTARPRDASR